MVALKTLEYVTNSDGQKKRVQLSIADFERMREELEDLADALALEKAKKEATGFSRWNNFVNGLAAARA